MQRHHHPHIHGHAWIVGVVGIAAGLTLMVFVPSLTAISNSMLLFAGFHIVGALVILLSAYSLGLRKIVSRLRGHVAPVQADGDFNFGWGPEWMNGLGVAAMVTLMIAAAIAITAPAWWPLSFACVLLAAAFFAGNQIMRSFQSRDHVVLPMVRLLRGETDHVLDAGCGAGRTTIALRRVLGGAHVTAVDRFDADYIDNGGRQQLDRNLKLAGIAEQVSVVRADLTRLPFDDACFDAAVSTNVFDHLGAGKPAALAEVWRTLKPGGRFLMAVWVPGWPMFAVANVLSLFLTSKAQWRKLAADAGFACIDEGIFNFAWFVVLEKPEAANA
jgi:SAM-dependent methyltransferase